MSYFDDNEAYILARGARRGSATEAPQLSFKQRKKKARRARAEAAFKEGARAHSTGADHRLARDAAFPPDGFHPAYIVNAWDEGWNSVQSSEAVKVIVTRVLDYIDSHVVALKPGQREAALQAADCSPTTRPQPGPQPSLEWWKKDVE